MVAVVTRVASIVPVMLKPVELVDAQITEMVAVLADVTVMSDGGSHTTSSRRFVSGSFTDGQLGVSRLAPEPGDRVQLRVAVELEVVPPVT
jgi:hypothetical protein